MATKTALDVSIGIAIRRVKHRTTITTTLRGPSGEILSPPVGHTYESTDFAAALDDALADAARTIEQQMTVSNPALSDFV